MVRFRTRPWRVLLTYRAEREDCVCFSLLTAHAGVPPTFLEPGSTFHVWRDGTVEIADGDYARQVAFDFASGRAAHRFLRFVGRRYPFLGVEMRALI